MTRPLKKCAVGRGKNIIIKHYISTCDTCQRASSESLKQSYILHDGKLTSCSLHVGKSSEQYRHGTETGCQLAARHA